MCRFFTLKHGSRIFYKHGVSGKKMPWSHDEQLFECWRDGKTGMPLVDANMRELKQTGGLLYALDLSEASFSAQQILQRLLHQSVPGLMQSMLYKAWLQPVRACAS